MFTHLQRVERDQVEHWVREAYTFPHFKAHVAEREEPEHGRVRITITITGPRDERLIANDRTAVYYATRSMDAMFPQIEDWVS